MHVKWSDRMKTRKKGDKYRPVVTIIKTKKDKPTVLEISGDTYVLKHKDQWPKSKR